MLQLAMILAGIWGALWAAYLQFSQHGHYLAVRRTWLSVVIGVGGNMLILLSVLPLYQWFTVLTVIGASAVGIIARSLYNERRDEGAIEEVSNASR